MRTENLLIGGFNSKVNMGYLIYVDLQIQQQHTSPVDYSVRVLSMVTTVCWLETATGYLDVLTGPVMRQ